MSQAEERIRCRRSCPAPAPGSLKEIETNGAKPNGEKADATSRRSKLIIPE
jgi:hypothetical protein